MAIKPRGYDYEECLACGGTGHKSRPGPGVDPKCAACGGLGMTKTPKENPQHSSASNEHYTPEPIVEAARSVLGVIELDPASCTLGQEVVKAIAWYGPGSELAEDGLAEPWMGKVFLNPPGGKVPEQYAGLGTRSNAALWWSALAGYWQEGEVEAAIFVGFTLEVLRAAQALDVPQPLDFPLCVPKQRIRFDTEEGGKRIASDSPTHANVIVYLPPKPWKLGKGDSTTMTAQFRRIFSPLGKCRI